MTENEVNSLEANPKLISVKAQSVYSSKYCSNRVIIYPNLYFFLGTCNRLKRSGKHRSPEELTKYDTRQLLLYLIDFVKLTFLRDLYIMN